MGSQTDATLGTSATLGPYFGIVSTIPSLALTAWVYCLMSIQSRNGPDLGRLGDFNLTTRAPDLLAVAAVAVLVAIISHPAQFIAVQLLEGYWGSSRAGIAAATRRRLFHARTRDAAFARRQNAVTELGANPQQSDSMVVGDNLNSRPEEAFRVLRLRSIIDSETATISIYPEPVSRVLPTRLGNILRRHELRAGASLQLPVLTWSTHIGMVAISAHTSYVQAQRTELDLAVRMTWNGAIASVVTALIMWPHGIWLASALIPYAAGWLGYRGALRAAQSYGRALEAWVNLNRFRLYEHLHLSLPGDSTQERAQNEDLEFLAIGHRGYSQTYSHPASPEVDKGCKATDSQELSSGDSSHE